MTISNVFIVFEFSQHEDKISKFCMLEKHIIWLTNFNTVTSSFCMLNCARSPEGTFPLFSTIHYLRSSFQSCRYIKLIFGIHTSHFLFLILYNFEVYPCSFCLHFQLFKLIIVKFISSSNIYSFVIHILANKK